MSDLIERVHNYRCGEATRELLDEVGYVLEQQQAEIERLTDNGLDAWERVEALRGANRRLTRYFNAVENALESDQHNDWNEYQSARAAINAAEDE